MKTEANKYQIRCRVECYIFIEASSEEEAIEEAEHTDFNEWEQYIVGDCYSVEPPVTDDKHDSKERVSRKIDDAINAILAAEKEMRSMVDANPEMPCSMKEEGLFELLKRYSAAVVQYDRADFDRERGNANNYIEALKNRDSTARLLLGFMLGREPTAAELTAAIHDEPPW